MPANGAARDLGDVAPSKPRARRPRGALLARRSRSSRGRRRPHRRPVPCLESHRPMRIRSRWCSWASSHTERVCAPRSGMSRRTANTRLSQDPLGAHREPRRRSGCTLRAVDRARRNPMRNPASSDPRSARRLVVAKCWSHKRGTRAARSRWAATESKPGIVHQLWIAPAMAA